MIGGIYDATAAVVVYQQLYYYKVYSLLLIVLPLYKMLTLQIHAYNAITHRKIRNS